MRSDLFRNIKLVGAVYNDLIVIMKYLIKLKKMGERRITHYPQKEDNWIIRDIGD